MFGHYLPNKNECATVAPNFKFRELNEALAADHGQPGGAPCGCAGGTAASQDTVAAAAQGADYRGRRAGGAGAGLHAALLQAPPPPRRCACERAGLLELMA